MTARTVSTADATTADPMFGAPVDPAFDNKSDNDSMMVGSDMYRRMQQRPKSSASGYFIGGVAAIALIGGGIFLATHQHHAGAHQSAQVAANSAINADQQAQASKSQAQTAQLWAQQSAAATTDMAQAKSVGDTGNPPAATTDTRPAPRHVMTRPHEAAVHRAVDNREAASASAAAAGVDAAALTPPPAPVTATQPAAPAAAAPAPVTATPAPTTPAPAPAATPAPTPDQTPAQPQSTTAPQ